MVTMESLLASATGNNKENGKINLQRLHDWALFFGCRLI